MTDHNTKMAAKEETVLRDNYDKLIEAAKHDLSWLARSFFTKGLLTKDNRDKVVRNRNGLGAALLVNCIETKVSVGNVQAFYTALDILKSKEGSACRDVALTMEVELRGERTTAQNTSRSTTATGNPVDKLTPKYELTVKNEISNVNNWFGLGEQLKMEHTTLEAIRKDHNVHGLAHQRNTMVHKWLKSDLTASWSKLCKALEKIHERFVAKAIRAKYIPHTASISTDDSEEDEEVKGQPEGEPHNGEENYSSDTTKPPPTQPAAYEVSDESSDEDHTLPEQHTTNDSLSEADIAEEPTPPPPPPPPSEPQARQRPPRLEEHQGTPQTEQPSQVTEPLTSWARLRQVRRVHIRKIALVVVLVAIVGGFGLCTLL